MARKVFLTPFIFCAIGVLWVFYPTLSTPLFDQIPGHIHDVRWINYTLEHTWLWVQQAPLHQALWAPPYFFPIENSGAFADILLGTAPVYWLWRMVTSVPQSAYQWWLVSVLVANFFIAYHLIRAIFHRSRLAASLGAYVFAFGGPVISQLYHSQLLTQFYLGVVIVALVKSFTVPFERRVKWLYLFFGSVVLQLYATFYIGWLLVVSILIAFLWALLVPRFRQRLINFVCQEAVLLLLLVALSTVALLPMVEAYLATVNQVGLRSFTEVKGKLPQVSSYLYHGPNSVLYGWLDRWDLFPLPPLAHEHHMGVGIVTAGLALIGVARNRNTAVMLLTLVAVTLIGLTLRLYGNITLWHIPFWLVPGAPALRSLTRLVLPLLLFIGIGLAFGLDRVRQSPRKKAPLVVAILVMVVLLEQLRVPESFSKQAVLSHTEAAAVALPAECTSFVYASKKPYPGLENDSADRQYIAAQVEAMWVGLEAEVPTLNGYSGQRPPDWRLQRSVLNREKDEIRFREAYHQWVLTHGLDEGSTCWLER